MKGVQYHLCWWHLETCGGGELLAFHAQGLVMATVLQCQGLLLTRQSPSTQNGNRTITTPFPTEKYQESFNSC